MFEWNRRGFLKVAGAATAQSLLTANTHLLAAIQDESKPIAANDHIQIALIGAGGQGQGDTKVALQVPGVKLVAVADCYNGRLEHSKELWGDDIFTTRDYAEILSRKDIDAVIVGTPDHWHKQVSVDAMKAGKDVYCEKPMIHHYADGPEMIEAARATNRIIQIGSQRVSSMIYAKAKDLLAAGTIGQLNMVTAHWDRNSAIGAWDYTVPLDASTETCDWPRFLGTAPKIPFNAEQFFQWRKWKAYGSGVAGDLFVHLFSGTHFVTGAHGPTRAMATGGLRFWKDGRNVPDVMLGLFDYPEASTSASASTSSMAAKRAKASSSPAPKAPSRSRETPSSSAAPRAKRSPATPSAPSPKPCRNASSNSTCKNIPSAIPPESRPWASKPTSPPKATATATTTSKTSSTPSAPESP